MFSKHPENFNFRSRITWVDITKGITIVLMVLGHSNLPLFAEYWIFIFHMPLFFILSGMTTNWAKGNLLSFSLNKLRKLGIPFFIYSGICLIAIHYMHLASLTWSRGWGEFALWFVPVLFVALIIAKVVYSVPEKIRLALFFLLPFISVSLRYFSIDLPWNMSVTPYAAFFIMLGGYIKNLLPKFQLTNIWWLFTTLWVTFAISNFWHLDMAHNQCLPILPITIGAIIGSLFMISISMIVDKHFSTLSKVCQTIGRETFVIIAFSQIIIMTLNKYWQVGSIVKYALLTMILGILIMSKNRLVVFWNSHIQKTK